MSWIKDLGEKSSRTDVWVVLIVLTYISCLFELVPCAENWYVTTILVGMFLDLGINVIANNLNRLKNDSKQ
jgi:hypothetical protein